MWIAKIDSAVGMETIMSTSHQIMAAGMKKSLKKKMPTIMSTNTLSKI